MSKDRWTFLTNHGHVFLCLAQHPAWRLRDVAAHVGITERAVQKIVTELVLEGYLERERVGRQNEYRVVRGRPMRHRAEQHINADILLDLLG
jgi:predicted transcriptional regulator